MRRRGLGLGRSRYRAIHGPRPLVSETIQVRPRRGSYGVALHCHAGFLVGSPARLLPVGSQPPSRLPLNKPGVRARNGADGRRPLLARSNGGVYSFGLRYRGSLPGPWPARVHDVVAIAAATSNHAEIAADRRTDRVSLPVLWRSNWRSNRLGVSPTESGLGRRSYPELGIQSGGPGRI